MMISKVTQEQSFVFYSGSIFFEIFLGLRRGVFFEWNFNIIFYKISNLSFYLSKNELK